MMGLVGAGIGIAIVPASVAKLTLDRVVYRRLTTNGVPPAELVAAWPTARTSPLIQRFIAAAQGVARALSPTGAPRG